MLEWQWVYEHKYSVHSTVGSQEQLISYLPRLLYTNIQHFYNVVNCWVVSSIFVVEIFVIIVIVVTGLICCQFICENSRNLGFRLYRSKN